MSETKTLTNDLKQKPKLGRPRIYSPEEAKRRIDQYKHEYYIKHRDRYREKNKLRMRRLRGGLKKKV